MTKTMRVPQDNGGVPAIAPERRLAFALRVLPYLVIAIVTWAAYSNSLDADFIFDDIHNITENANVHMTELTVARLRDTVTGNPTPRPVAYFTFALNYYFHQWDVTGYHVVNTIIHILSGFAVYALALHVLPLLITRGGSVRRGEAMLLALGAALIFAAHPVQTQSVTYIVQRMTSLCGLFYLTSMLCYIAGRSFVDQRRAIAVIWWVGALLLWILALGTKQYAVTLPMAILLYEWIARGQRFELNRRVLLAGGLGLLLMVGVVLVFKSGLFFQGGTLHRLLVKGYAERDFTMQERVLTQFRVVWHYLSLIVWPVPSRLILVYDYPVSTSILKPVTTLLSIAGVVGLLGVAFAGVRRWPLVSFGIFWYFLHLAVESTIIPLELVYEHRLYLPLIGPALVFVWLLRLFLSKPVARVIVIGVLVTALAIGTRARNEKWRHSLSMWIDNAIKVPTEPRAHYNIASMQYSVGRKREALLAVERAVRYEPRFQIARVMRANLLAEFGQFDAALRELDYVIRMDPDVSSRMLRNQWDAYMERARIHQVMGRYALAEIDATSAIEYPPIRQEPKERQDWKRAEALTRRGEARTALGRYADARDDYEEAISLFPESILAHNNLAWILATAPDPAFRDGERAVHHATIAADLTGRADFRMLSTLAASLAEAGQFEEAARVQRRCVELAPLNEKARYRAQLDRYENGEPYRAEELPE